MVLQEQAATGKNTMNLAAIQILASTCKTSMAYNALDYVMAIQVGLDTLLANQTIHHAYTAWEQQHI